MFTNLYFEVYMYIYLSGFSRTKEHTVDMPFFLPSHIFIRTHYISLYTHTGVRIRMHENKSININLHLYTYLDSLGLESILWICPSSFHQHRPSDET
jgi:hypothetical protein